MRSRGRAGGRDVSRSSLRSRSKTASSRESVILQPDKNVTGGMKVVRETGASNAAQAYIPAG